MCNSSIGCSHIEHFTSTTSSPTIQPSFRGQIAMFCLFSEGLSNEKVQTLFNIGYEEPHQIK
jgi:hypothetical protein